jgi:biotin carboxyl carrier protein
MATIDVKSPMPANIYEIMIASGDTVSEGQELLILESMKMEIPVESPAAGTIAEICVETGTPVAEDDVLLRIDTGA